MLSDQWMTPVWLIDAVRRVLGIIDFDPASSEEAQKRVLAEKCFTESDEYQTFDQPWHGNIFLNPPYSAGICHFFIGKLLGEIKEGNVKEAIVILNNATDTNYSRAIFWAGFLVCFPKRINFDHETLDGKSNRYAQMICYYGEHPDRFYAEFKQLGPIMKIGKWE